MTTENNGNNNDNHFDSPLPNITTSTPWAPRKVNTSIEQLIQEKQADILQVQKELNAARADGNWVLYNLYNAGLMSNQAELHRLLRKEAEQRQLTDEISLHTAQLLHNFMHSTNAELSDENAIPQTNMPENINNIPQSPQPNITSKRPGAPKRKRKSIKDLIDEKEVLIADIQEEKNAAVADGNEVSSNLLSITLRQNQNELLNLLHQESTQRHKMARISAHTRGLFQDFHLNHDQEQTMEKKTISSQSKDSFFYTSSVATTSPSESDSETSNENIDPQSGAPTTPRLK